MSALTVKCIGGERDGYIFNINSSHRVGSIIRVSEEVKFLLEPRFDDNGLPDITVKVYYYRLAVLRFGQDGSSLYYLVPKNWTDKQAVIHQFKK